MTNRLNTLRAQYKPPEQRAKASPSGITTGDAHTGQLSGKCTSTASTGRELRPNFFNFWNHITAAVHTHGITNAYIQTVNFTNIMQGYI